MSMSWPFRNTLKTTYGCAAVIVVVVASVRLWLLLSTPLVPGINGGYYLVQVRALIERGELALPDMPLLFYIEALMARLLQMVTGSGTDESVLVSVKLIDGILPALAAVPIFLLLDQWSRIAPAPRWIAAVGTTATVLGFPALSVVGDLQKNSFALALLATLLWQLHDWMIRPSQGRLLNVGLLLGLIGIAHIGVLGATMIMLAAIAGVLLFMRNRINYRAPSFLVVLVSIAVVMAVVLVWWHSDIARAHRLWNAMAHPVSFAQRDSSPQASTQTASLRTSLPWLLIAVAGIGIIRTVWRRRHKLPSSAICTVIGLTLSVVALTSPVCSPDMTTRLALISVLPGVMVIYFAVLQIPLCGLRNTLALGIALVFLLPSVPLVAKGGDALLSRPAAQELRSLSAFIHSPAETLIIAPHGLEWWAAWTLRTKICNPAAAETVKWADYSKVLCLEQKRWFLNRPPPPPLVGKATAIPWDTQILQDGEFFRLTQVPMLHGLPQQSQAPQ